MIPILPIDFDLSTLHNLTQVANIGHMAGNALGVDPSTLPPVSQVMQPIDIGNGMTINPALAATGQVIRNVKNRFTRKQGRNSGEQIKFDLGLENYKYVMIQKVIGIGIPIYIISYDSRRPTIYLTIQRLARVDTSNLYKIKKHGSQFLANKFRLTPAMSIEKTHPDMNSSLVICRDLAGEYLKSRKMNKPINEDVENLYPVFDYNL
jgi:hypothetical protein